MKINNNNFSNYLKKNYIFEKNPVVAVAVSGGPDSMALLFLTNFWIKKLKGHLIALIVDHKLREESTKEARWIKEYLLNFDIESKILNVKKNNINKKNMNEARINRYNLLTNYCIKNYILHLFIAHHKDDFIETYINRKIAGSDFEGLKSIQENIVINKTNIIRPLIKFSKTDIYKYNNYNNIAFIEDPTNLNLNYTRSIIRKYLKNNNTYVKSIDDEINYINKHMPKYQKMITEILNNNLVHSSPKKLEFNYSNLLKLDDLVLEKILKTIYNFLVKDKKILRSKKTQILIRELKNPNFKKFNLGGIFVTKLEKLLVFSQIDL